MTDLFTRIAQRALEQPHGQAVLFGCGLGWLAWELSRVPERTAFNLAMVLVMVISGSTSFVLYALHSRSAKRHPRRADRLAEARVYLSLIGCSLALSINALQFTLV